MRARAVLILPLTLLLACRGAPPPAIKDEIARTARGDARAATVVFFTDFQCPFCRRTHAALASLLAARAGRVRVVVRHVPLPRHPDAQTAARAAVCVATLTKEETNRSSRAADDYVDALFTASDLSPDVCEELALARGVEREAFRQCVASPATDARIREDIAIFDAVGGDGVPLLFIGGTRLEGAQSRAELEAALDDALAR